MCECFLNTNRCVTVNLSFVTANLLHTLEMICANLFHLFTKCHAQLHISLRIQKLNQFVHIFFTHSNIWTSLIKTFLHIHTFKCIHTNCSHIQIWWHTATTLMTLFCYHRSMTPVCLTASAAVCFLTLKLVFSLLFAVAVTKASCLNSLHTTISFFYLITFTRQLSHSCNFSSSKYFLKQNGYPSFLPRMTEELMDFISLVTAPGRLHLI